MDVSFSDILLALGLTLIAGLSTGIGSLMAFYSSRTNKKFLSWALGLSAGVMVYISFMELLPESMGDIQKTYSGKLGEIIVLFSFFAGVALIALIDWLIPEDENPHEVMGVESMRRDGNDRRLHRTAFMLALAIGIHNFPEGIATFIAGLEGLSMALPVVVAIAIHNIPEGIAVSVPIYHAVGDRRKALKFSLVSGLAEPVGAVFAALFILPFWSPSVNAILMSAVAGIMVYISFDELLPGSERFGHHHMAMVGVVSGMVIMAFSLLLF
ncbi:MAG: zinc transporter ZupT [Paramuribaculum sp.]|nr:zinc transporter ZupT [Paramuribaculum sp.]